MAYLILAPDSPDLAAASYRSELFSRVGFTLWDNSWYGGHHLPAYSLLAPALGALIGPRTVAALAMTLATALFARLVAGRFPARAVTAASLWFAFGASVSLLSSRVPFDLGLALGLGSALAAKGAGRSAGQDAGQGGDRGAGGRRTAARLALAFTLAALCAVASPVAGAFLGLAYLAWALAGPPRAWALALCLAALVPIVLLVLAFPEGGVQPFVASAFYPALLATLALAALIARARRDAPTMSLRVLWAGALLYALALAGAYLVHTSVGGNADRLGSLVAGPVAALVLAGAPVRSRLGVVLLVLVPLLSYWQAKAPVSDYVASASEPATDASYYAPLLRELHTLGVGYGARPARIEVVATADHWEARWVAPHVMIARGWERQLDVLRNGLFYEPAKALTAARYRAWLSSEAISYVALPDAKLDYSARAEARLLRGTGAAAGGRGPTNAYLREVWRSAHWRLYAVSDPTPLAQPPARVSAVGVDSFTLLAPRAGSYEVRLRFTPYWAPAGAGACVSQAPGEWTEVQASRAGAVHVVIRFSLARVFDHGKRCA